LNIAVTDKQDALIFVIFRIAISATHRLCMLISPRYLFAKIAYKMCILIERHYSMMYGNYSGFSKI